MTGFSHTDERSFEGLKLTNQPPRKSWLKKFLGRLTPGLFPVIEDGLMVHEVAVNQYPTCR